MLNDCASQYNHLIYERAFNNNRSVLFLVSENAYRKNTNCSQRRTGMINSVGVVAKKHKDFGQLADGYLKKTPIFQFIIVSLMFPLWGTAASLNDILITQFKTVFALNDAATAFVQSAFYGGYFLVAIPASFVIRKASYKVTCWVGHCAKVIAICTVHLPCRRSKWSTPTLPSCAPALLSPAAALRPTFPKWPRPKRL